MFKGIFLFYSETPDNRLIIESLQSCNISIRILKVNPAIVSNLVPNALQREAESWLIIYQPDKPKELLILPFPNREYHHKVTNPQDIRYFLSDLIPTLSQYLIDKEFDIARDWIGPFGFIRIDISLDSLLNEKSNVKGLPSQIQSIHYTLLNTNQTIQRHRNKMLNNALRDRNPDLLNELDDILISENNKLLSFLQSNISSTVVVPQIVYNYMDVIDNETKDFLISSETVKEFAYANEFDNFDYSVPGCGLWKAVEREMNLSVILNLRIEKGIAKYDQPWVGLKEKNSKIEIQTGPNHTVNINQREPKDQSKLQGIMLGPMKYMLNYGYNNGLCNTLSGDLSLSNDLVEYFLGQRHQGSNLTKHSLPWHLQELMNLRNEHAHISAMSQDQFEELHKLVLPSNNNSDTCLVKILELKRKIFNFRQWQHVSELFMNIC